MLLRIVAVLCLLSPAVFAQCATGSAVNSEAALTGATCTALPIQKSDVYTATTGFSYTVPNGITLEIINAGALLATGTIILPASPTDGQPLTIEAPKGLTLVSIQANSGQSLSALAISTMAANNPYRLKWASATSTWYPN